MKYITQDGGEGYTRVTVGKGGRSEKMPIFGLRILWAAPDLDLARIQT